MTASRPMIARVYCQRRTHRCAASWSQTASKTIGTVGETAQHDTR